MFTAIIKICYSLSTGCRLGKIRFSSSRNKEQQLLVYIKKDTVLEQLSKSSSILGVQG